MQDGKLNVLFVCTGNSARSIIAEALLRHQAGDRFQVFSAGTHPYSDLNPLALETLETQGIKTSALRAKNISEFQTPAAPPLHFVFTVCDLAANEDCPIWADQPISAHWGLPDPVKTQGTEAQKRRSFHQTLDVMRNRIAAFAALPFQRLDRASLQQEIDAIGMISEPL